MTPPTRGGMRRALPSRYAPGWSRPGSTPGWARCARGWVSGWVLRRSATRLVVRFEGELALIRIRPHLVRVLPGEVPGNEC
jgi:hypothetical protein